MPSKPRVVSFIKAIEPELELSLHSDTRSPYHFSRLVDLALEHTQQHQRRYLDERLATMSGPEFLRIIDKDIDYPVDNPNVEHFARNIAANLREFHAVVSTASTPEALYKRCSNYVETEQHRLFYRTNDIVAARIKQDYFNTFLDHVLTALEEEKNLPQELKARFGQLKAAYKLGFEAYDYSRYEVGVESGYNSRGLMDEAENILSARTKKTPQPHNDAMEEGAQEAARKLLLNNYHIKLEDHEVPPPLLFAVLRHAASLAEVRMKRLHPALDMKDPKADWEETFRTIYEPIASHAIQAIEKAPHPATYAQVSQELLRSLRTESNIPEQFPDMVAKAATLASDDMQEHIRSALAEDAHRLGLHTKLYGRIPRSAELFESLMPGYNSAIRVKFDMRPFAEEARTLTQAYDKESLLSYLNDTVAGVIEKGHFDWQHPAAMVAAQKWVTAFRRHLGEAMHDAKCYDAAFAEQMKETENAMQLAYQSRNTAGEWLMGHTENGSDHLFEHAILQRSWDPRSVEGEDMSKLRSSARYQLEFMGTQRGIPEKIAGNPLIPLMFERCKSIAEAEYEQAGQNAAHTNASISHADKIGVYRERKGFTPRNYKSRALRAAEKENPEMMEGLKQALEAGNDKLKEKILNNRAVAILKEVLASITPSIPAEEQLKDTLGEQPPLPPFTPRNITAAFDYLDQLEGRILNKGKNAPGLH